MPRQTQTEDEVDQGRQRILHATARITNKDGIGGLSMRALAAGLNLTTGALYRYFPSTQDILLDYGDQALRALVQRIATIEQSEAGKPRRIADVGLPAGDVLYITRVGQDH